MTSFATQFPGRRAAPVAIFVPVDFARIREGEEPSVQEEHAPLIERLRVFVRGEV